MDIPELYDDIRRFVRKKEEYVERAKDTMVIVSKLLTEDGVHLRPRMILKLSTLRDHLSSQIYEFENLKFFEFDVTFVVEKYHKLNNTNVSIPFFTSDKSILKNHSRKKRETTAEFVRKMKQYPPLVRMVPSSLDAKVALRSSPPPCVCGNASEFIRDEDRTVCAMCSTEQLLISNISSFSDVGRVNMSGKYTYNRKTHFRDCIMQYQGKQKTNIPLEIYNAIRLELDKCKAVDLSERDHVKKYAKITRLMVLNILKSLNIDDVKKYYDDIVLIHHTITGQECPDIEHLEDVLLEDFDKLTTTYDNRTDCDSGTGPPFKRKNFINAQFVLYQLLRKHNYKCSNMDFLTLKKPERKHFHHDICKNLFKILGWKYSYSI